MCIFSIKDVFNSRRPAKCGFDSIVLDFITPCLSNSDTSWGIVLFQSEISRVTKKIWSVSMYARPKVMHCI